MQGKIRKTIVNFGDEQPDQGPQQSAGQDVERIVNAHIYLPKGNAGRPKIEWPPDDRVDQPQCETDEGGGK